MYLCNRLDVIRVGDSSRSFPKAMGRPLFYCLFFCASNLRQIQKIKKKKIAKPAYKQHFAIVVRDSVGTPNFILG